MFGNNEYWWAGLLVFFFFVGLNALILALRNKPKVSYAIAYCIAVFLLVQKTLEYIVWQALGYHMKFPVEFSAVSYFLFGIFVTFRIKKADGFAVFVAVLAGLIYSVFFTLQPQSFIGDFINGDEAPVSFVLAIINHHLLYFGGMLMLVNVRRYPVKNVWQYVLGVGIMVAYSWLVHLYTPYSVANGMPIIIQITNGQILTRLFSDPPLWGVVLYYLLAVSTVVVLLGAHFALNHKFAALRSKKGMETDAFPDTLSAAFRKTTV